MKKRDALAFLATVAAAATTGCNQPTYLQETRTLETRQAMMGGYAGDTITYTIPIKPPTAQDRAALASEQARLRLPLPVPWVGVRDLPVEVQYTLRNLDSHPVRALLTLGGGNEFGLYDPTLFYNPNDPEAIAPPPLAGTTPIHLEVGESRQLVFREDDIAESAIDLEAIVRYPSMPALTTPFKVLNSRSDVNPVGLEGVPVGDVTPQQVVLQLNLSADGHVACDWVVRTRDLKGRLARPNDPAQTFRDLGVPRDMARNVDAATPSG